ncbi:hypothetical protein [Cohnella hongkongensis]|uniref:MalT-like TPR region domain-containing protein n=1 Tax=Cohnella hongkongensis TaxID=178337 RepID=A0ABV9F8M7_9BACL
MKSLDIKPNSTIPQIRTFEAIVLLRACLFLGITTEALMLGEKLLQAALSANNPRNLIVINLLLAQIHRKQGDVVEALDKLDRALAEAHEHGYVQMVVDEGAALSVLLKQYRKQRRLKDYPELREFSGMIAKAIPKDEIYDAASSPITASLTRQENRVFQLLVSAVRLICCSSSSR